VYNRTPSASTAARYEEAALQRAELDAVKRENEMLKAKVKELERSLQKANEPVVASSS
jgi:cell division protein FtsB